MESKGYVVYMVLFDYIFLFREKKKENTCTYFTIKYINKDFDYHLNTIRCDLCTLYKAQPVKTKYSGVELYRIPKALDEEFYLRCKTIRNIYLLRVMKSELILAMFFLISFTALVIIKYSVIILLIVIIILLYTIWRIVCLVRMNRLLYKSK